MITYEFPLNEFVRNLLKVDLQRNLLIAVGGDITETSLRTQISVLLEYYSLLSRLELKNELIKETEKRLKKLRGLLDLSQVDQNTLGITIDKMQQALDGLKTIASESYSTQLPYLIDTIKQRENVPAGRFDFDLPGYKCWISSNPSSCQQQANNIVSTFEPVVEAASILLGMLRQSSTPTNETAVNGFYQVKDSHNPELLIIKLDQNLNVFPEISGGKHRAFIRFMELSDIQEKPLQTKRDVSFTLQCGFI